MPTYTKYDSPKGISHYPKLIKPDTKFNPEGTYSTGLFISEAAYDELMEACKESFVDEFGKKKPFSAAQLPISKVAGEDGEDDQFMLKASSKKQPKFFDAKGNPIKRLSLLEKLGGGSKLRLKCSLGAYATGGKVGVKLYLNEVQVITLVEYEGGGFKADDDEDGFDAKGAREEAEDEEADAEAGSSDSSTEDDDIPF